MLIFDGDCAFCTTTAQWVEARLPEGYPVVPWQHIDDLGTIGLSQEQVQAAAYWIGVDGVPQRGHRAIAYCGIASGGLYAAMGWLMLVPPVSWIAAGCYWLIARYRHRLPGGTPACRLPQG